MRMIGTRLIGIGFMAWLVACVSIDYEGLRLRAEQGEAQAQYELGLDLDFGDGIPQDLTEAARWYAKAAEQGHAAAQNSLGSMYQAGDGVPQDYASAVSWYEKAAAQKHAEATNSLASMYDMALGVAEDNVRAAELYEQAAELGSVRAMLNLGILLVQGQEGVDMDRIEAYKWLELARFATQISNDAQVRWRVRGALDELRGSMTAAEISQAEGRARAWIQRQKSK